MISLNTTETKNFYAPRQKGIAKPASLCYDIRVYILAHSVAHGQATEVGDY